jgi:hypothetical protein
MDKPTEPTLDEIAAALAAVEGSTPTAVLDAFLPRPVSTVGQKLVPLTSGHELLLAHVKHPLSTGAKWEDFDVLMALFIFSRQSRDLFELVNQDQLENAFFAFVDSIPPQDIPKLGQDVAAHWMRSRRTALAMTNEHTTAKKKTVALAGSSPPSHPVAKRSVFRWMLSCMTFLLRKFTR